MRRRRYGAQSIGAFILLLIAVALVTASVPVELDSPAFCTGDRDDSGGAWEPVAISPDRVSTAVEHALTPAPCAHPTLPPQPPHAPPGPPPRRLFSRAPLA